MQKARMNAVLHVISALCILLLVLILVFIAGAKFISPWEPGLLVPLGLLMISLEIYTAVAQWRRPPSKRPLSIVLHLFFAAAVLTALTFEFISDQPESVISWFWENNYLLLAGLAFARICAAIVFTICPDSPDRIASAGR